MPEPDILKYIQETQAPITLRDSEGRVRGGDDDGGDV